VRIRSSKHRDRTWVVVLASCLGVYLVLAVGFHWLLQPIVKDSESTASKLPSAMFAAYPDGRRAEPTTSWEFLRSGPQRPAARLSAPAGEPAAAETSGQAERAVEARTPKPRKVAAPRGHGAFPGYSGNRPF